MTMSKLASKYIPAANHYGRRTTKVCKITPHHMAGNLTIEGCGAVFQTRQASSNYGIGSDGRIACYVDEDCGAWTSSSYWNDNQAITIEVANSSQGVADGTWAVTDAAWRSLVDLCVDVCQRYGFRLNYTGGTGGSLTEHRMFDATACPGAYLHDRMAKLAKEVNERLEDEVTEQDKKDIARYVMQASINYKNGDNDKPHTACLADRVGYIDYHTHKEDDALKAILSKLDEVLAKIG